MQSTALIEASEMFTVRLLAKRLGVSYLTIHRAVSNGFLETRRVGAQHRISGVQVLDWLERGGRTTK